MVTKAVSSVCSEDARPGEAHTQACASGALTSQPHLLTCPLSRERLGIQSPQEAAGHDQTQPQAPCSMASPWPYLSTSFVPDTGFPCTV